MICEMPDPGLLADFAADVTVIGAGPVGILTALAMARSGQRVLVLESGGREVTLDSAALSGAENLRPDNHFEPGIAISRQLGGTGNLWRGRCLPLDPVDFLYRPWTQDEGLGPWPIGPDDLSAYLAPALAGLGAGAPVFREALPGVKADDAFAWESLERWSIEPRTHILQARALAETPGLMVALGVTVTGFAWEDAGHLSGLETHFTGAGGGRRATLSVNRVVLAAGGNESTRLLLSEQRQRPGLFGGRDGPLGRYYMGHLTGEVADISFSSAVLHDGMAFHPDPHGSYVRRRLTPSLATQAEARLNNVSLWPVVPKIANPAHRSGALSVVFLAIYHRLLGQRLMPELIRTKHLGPGPPAWRGHLSNVITDLPGTALFATTALWQYRLAKQRPPGLFLTNRARRYGLSYHAEHLPHPDSRLTLSEQSDALGMPRLRIDLRFSDEDAAAVLRAHDVLEAWLARNDLARLDYHHSDREARAEAVLELACDGAHQIGTIRMGTDSRTSVVGADCQVHGVSNLFVISTAVLPTSGQANPTLTAVQLGLRLAANWSGSPEISRGSKGDSLSARCWSSSS